MSITPSVTSGYVYYVRLKTEHGIFYKIGFTSKDTVFERFSYGGSQNHKLVDKVLMHKYCFHAYDIEQKLHQLFENYRAFDKYSFNALFKDFAQYPFYKDGQTELYKKDVLNLDPNPPFKFFGSYRCKAIQKRKLNQTRWHDSVDKEFIKRDKQKSYDMIDELVRAPLLESKEEFRSRKGPWVHDLVLWGIRNCACSFWEDRTIHGAMPLPEAQDDLLDLTDLSPAWGFVDSIPKQIIYLQQLEIVYFFGKGLTNIPDELYELPKLKDLNLAGNEFVNISSKIGFLLSLEVLDISLNDKLKKLPVEIARLPKLKSLGVDKRHWKFLSDNGLSHHVFAREASGLEEKIEHAVIIKYGMLDVDEHDNFQNGCCYYSVIRQYVFFNGLSSESVEQLSDELIEEVQQHLSYCENHTWDSYIEYFGMSEPEPQEIRAMSNEDFLAVFKDVEGKP